MSDDYFTTPSRKSQLTVWITGEMLRGAGVAAGFLLVIGFSIWAIYGIGLLLPSESRDTPDPNATLEPLVQPLTDFA